MNNCLTCGKCSFNKSKDAVCISADGVEHLVLEYKLYDTEGEFRATLVECGNNCDKWVAKVKCKRNHSSVDAPVGSANEVGFKSGLGWLVAAGECGVIISLMLIMVIVGVIHL